MASKLNKHLREVAPISASNDVVRAVGAAVAAELHRRGFTIGPNAVLVDIAVRRFYNNFNVGFLFGDAVADFDADVAVREADGGMTLSKHYFAQGTIENVFIMTGNNVREALIVDSKLGAGTTFRLCLPRTIESAPASEAKTDEPVRGGAETIMVVEDNPALRRIVAKQLAELGYRVIPAENAMAALAAFDAAQDIDLLLTGVVMPGAVDGTELAHKLRARQPQLKVLLTSGFATARVGETSRELNSPLLSKPYRKTELARAVRKILDA